MKKGEQIVAKSLYKECPEAKQFDAMMGNFYEWIIWKEQHRVNYSNTDRYIHSETAYEIEDIMNRLHYGHKEEINAIIAQHTKHTKEELRGMLEYFGLAITKKYNTMLLDATHKKYYLYPIFEFKDIQKFTHFLSKIPELSKITKDNIYLIIVAICRSIDDIMSKKDISDHDLEIIGEVKNMYWECERLEIRKDIPPEIHNTFAIIYEWCFKEYLQCCALGFKAQIFRGDTIEGPAWIDSIIKNKQYNAVEILEKIQEIEIFLHTIEEQRTLHWRVWLELAVGMRKIYTHVYTHKQDWPEKEEILHHLETYITKAREVEVNFLKYIEEQNTENPL